MTGGCSTDEVQLITDHERAHLRAHDNLKRSLIDGCPDVLRWTATGRDIAAAWSAAAEDAADDAATAGGTARASRWRSVLLRVARMAIGDSPAPQFASALVGLTGVERRVRRLADACPLPRASRVGLRLALGGAIATIGGAAGNTEFLALTYATAELDRQPRPIATPPGASWAPTTGRGGPLGPPWAGLKPRPYGAGDVAMRSTGCARPFAGTRAHRKMTRGVRLQADLGRLKPAPTSFCNAL